MLGAIAGDVIGSVYEGRPVKTARFPLFSAGSRFTDDTVLTVAIADAILNKYEYGVALKHWGRRYPDAGYGGKFYHWLFSPDAQAYNSWGNGAAMRVSAAVTHNHPEGIKGAQATALCIYLARQGSDKDHIKSEIQQRFHYDVNRSLQDIRPDYSFDVSCQGSVPESIIAFLESTDYESVVRNAISLGGDSDTMACIACGIAQAYYKIIPQTIKQEVLKRLPEEFVDIINAFDQRFTIEY
jgi:ADP-ribosylglycohydrolase